MLSPATSPPSFLASSSAAKELRFNLGERGSNLARELILTTPSAEWELSARRCVLHDVYYRDRGADANLPVFATEFFVYLPDELRLSVSFSPDAHALRSPHDHYHTPLTTGHQTGDRILLDQDYSVSLSVYRPKLSNGLPPQIAAEKLLQGSDAREMYWNLFQRSVQENPQFLGRLSVLVGESPLYKPLDGSSIKASTEAYTLFPDAEF